MSFFFKISLSLTLILGFFFFFFVKEEMSLNPKREISIGSRQNPLSPLYKIQMPASWRIQEGARGKKRLDTKEPLITFFSQDGEISLTLHSFPFKDLSERIPPDFNLMRWKNQMKPPLDIMEKNVSFGGFTGKELFIENTKESVFALALQLSAFHVQKLKEEGKKDFLADITFKAKGTPSSMETHREDIEEIVRSFQLIEYLSCDELFS